MKKTILSILCACACAGISFAAASPAATQAWVSNYVLGLLGGTNGVQTVTSGTNRFDIVYELYNTYALGVTNSVHATITNGAYFASLGGGVYTNAQLATFISSTPTNMIWNGIASHTNALGQTMFGETFGVVGTRITASKAKQIKGE